MTTRRKVLGTIATGCAIGVAGCNTGLLAKVQDLECGVSLTSGSNIQCNLLVENIGPGGDFEVGIRTLNENGVVIGESSETVYIGMASERVVNIQIDERGDEREVFVRSA